MKAITRIVSIAAVIALSLTAVAQAAPKTERARKYFTVSGQVLQINEREHTFLVSDRSSAKLYLIKLSEGAAFKITFGRYMGTKAPGFDNVFIKERIEIRCKRNESERLAQLPDGRSAITAIAATR